MPPTDRPRRTHFASLAALALGLVATPVAAQPALDVMTAQDPVKLNPLQGRLPDQMVDYLAHVGELGSQGEWQRFDPEREDIMTFRLPAAEVVSGGFATFHRCAFWDRAGCC
jgi:hypothetical protein